ncbi:MAG: hypothetical protein ACRD5R_01150 [Candidatus Acidiferrales bacterium]
MRHGMHLRSLAAISFLVTLAGLAQSVACAQQPPTPQLPSAPLPQQASPNAVPPCIQPAVMLRMADYDGPLQKVVGAFARPLERKVVHPPPRYRSGARLCTLDVKHKFALFVQDSFDPVTFLGAGFDAGLDQAQNSDPSYGQGAQGYGRRFGAEVAGQVSSRFLKDFAYPSIFFEDPRYYRMVHGHPRNRLLHALEHTVVAQRDNGNLMFNFSEWLGTTSTVVLNNTYHPGNRRGFSPAAQRVGYSVLQDAGFDVLREFWPDISRKFKLPFRGQSEPSPDNPTPAAD